MKYGLVLAGGGVRGAYHIGVWKALRELEFDITAVVGSSIGAVNGALIAQDDYELAKHIWKNIEIGDIVKLPPKMKERSNLFGIKNIADIITEIRKHDGLDMSPFEELLKQIIDENKIRNSSIDFGISTFSITKKNAVYKFKEDIPAGEIIKYLMASASLPGFKSAEIDSDKFMDGGVTNNMPVNMLLDKGVDNIITVDIRGTGIYRNFNLAGKNVINIRYEEPKMGMMEFERDCIIKSMKEGYLECMKALGYLEGKIYSFKTEDYRAMRGIYSKELIEGLEYAARVYDIDETKIYSVKELIEMVMKEYSKYSGEGNLGRKLKGADDNTFVAWLVKVLEKGKSDFIKEKLSALGTNYDAASAILYFKRKK